MIVSIVMIVMMVREAKIIPFKQLRFKKMRTPVEINRVMMTLVSHHMRPRVA